VAERWSAARWNERFSRGLPGEEYDRLRPAHALRGRSSGPTPAPELMAISMGLRHQVTTQWCIAIVSRGHQAGDGSSAAAQPPTNLSKGTRATGSRRARRREKSGDRDRYHQQERKARWRRGIGTVVSGESSARRHATPDDAGTESRNALADDERAIPACRPQCDGGLACHRDLSADTIVEKLVPRRAYRLEVRSA